MLGPAKPRRLDQPIAVSLEDLVPPDHFYRHLDRDAFTCDAKRDQYCCPQGHLLPLARSKRTEDVVVYRADSAVCNACPVKAKCMTSDRGRTIQRSIYENYLEKVRGYHVTEAYQKAIRKRQVWVELHFAETKEWHGLRRLRLRGLLNMNIQGLLIADEALLIAAGQNPKRLLSRSGLGRRPWPTGAAGLVLPIPTPPLPALT